MSKFQELYNNIKRIDESDDSLDMLMNIEKDIKDAFGDKITVETKQKGGGLYVYDRKDIEEINNWLDIANVSYIFSNKWEEAEGRYFLPLK